MEFYFLQFEFELQFIFLFAISIQTQEFLGHSQFSSEFCTTLVFCHVVFYIAVE